jgi:hypothetical protein
MTIMPLSSKHHTCDPLVASSSPNLISFPHAASRRVIGGVLAPGSEQEGCARWALRRGIGRSAGAHGARRCSGARGAGRGSGARGGGVRGSGEGGWCGAEQGGGRGTRLKAVGAAQGKAGGGTTGGRGARRGSSPAAWKPHGRRPQRGRQQVVQHGGHGIQPSRWVSSSPNLNLCIVN